MLEVLWVLVEMDPVAVSSCPAEQQSNTSLYLKKKKKVRKKRKKKQTVVQILGAMNSDF
jgi:hypothetical protein